MRVSDLYKSNLSPYDPYVYPGTNVLINKQNIIDQQKLNEYERLNVSLKLADLHLYEVSSLDINILFDVNHLKNIHEYLFEDIYPFAGQFRNVDISKGNTSFCKAVFIEDNLQKLLLLMKKELLSVKNREQYIDRISFYYAELNYIHPFRDGNGRTIREFIREYVSVLNNFLYFANYEMNYSDIDSDKLLEATIYSVNNNHFKLINEFSKALYNKKHLKVH